MSESIGTWEEHFAAIKARLCEVAAEAGVEAGEAFYDVCFKITEPKKLEDRQRLITVTAAGRTTFVTYILKADRPLTERDRFEQFKARVNALLAKHLPVATPTMTAGEIDSVAFKARVIIKAEAEASGYNPAALSTRYVHGKPIFVV